MTEIQPTITLTQEQIDFFHENGYLAIDAITTQDEVARMREVYDHIFAKRAGRDVGDQFDLAGSDEEGKEAALPQILNPSKYAPELAQTMLRVNAMAISKQLLGEDVTYGGDHAILKPARSGAPTPWHQDEAYWDPQWNCNALSVWIPLQEANLENGCMQFIPGSHKLAILPHRHINNDPRIHGLELDCDYDTSNAVACPIPAGGATFHYSKTLHYTGANHSDQPRRAYILGYGASGVKLETPRDFWWQREERSTHTARKADKSDVLGHRKGED